MPTPEFLSQLTDLGGAGLFVLFVVVAAVGLHRQWWVPGWVLRDERDRRHRAERAADRATQAIEWTLQRARGRESATTAQRPPAPDEDPDA